MLSFPINTNINKVITKAKFYDKVSVSAAVKRAFTSQVESIVWRNKLSAKTLNVQTGKRVIEIDVFEVALKSQQASDSLLRTIDNGVPHHILFLLQFDGLWQAAIGYKEIGKNVITLTVKEYYRTPWMPLDHIHLLVSGMTMDEVFDNFVRQINTSLPEESTQSLRADLEKQKKSDSIQKKIDVLNKKIRSEKQPRRQFELFRRIRELQAQLKDRQKWTNAE